jgi:hypothetical protein
MTTEAVAKRAKVGSQFDPLALRLKIREPQPINAGGVETSAG